MFFAHELLVGPKGKFTLIWRAAVKKEKLKRRQLESLDVSEVCQALKKYIRPRSDSRMGSITGFSLRLSAQLVYGVAVCYNWKVSYILDDAMSSWKAVVIRKRTLQDLSLPQAKKSRKSHGTVENFQLDIRFDADPMFGEVYGGNLDVLPMLPPRTTSEESSSSSDESKKRRRSSAHAVVDVSEITMNEEIPTMREDGDIIFGAEAAPFEMEDLESLGKQRTGFLDSIGPAQVPEVTTPPAAILAETPTMPKPPKRRRKGDRVEESVLAVPLEEEVPAAAQEPSSLNLGSLNEYELPVRRHKKPRKLIVDPKVERTANEIKKQIATKSRTFEEYRDEGLLDEPLNLVPMDLLTVAPTFLHRHFEIARIGAARERLVDGQDVLQDMYTSRVHSILSELSSPQRVDVTETTEESSIHTARDVSNVRDGLGIGALPDDESLLLTDHSRSRRRTQKMDASRVSEFGGDVSEIVPQESIDERLVEEQPIPEEFPMPPPGDDLELMPIAEEDLLRMQEISVMDEVQRNWGMHDEVTSFSEIAPPGMVTKAEAAKRFYSLLVHAKAGRVYLSQDEGFSEVHIFNR